MHILCYVLCDVIWYTVLEAGVSAHVPSACAPPPPPILCGRKSSLTLHPFKFGHRFSFGGSHFLHILHSEVVAVMSNPHSSADT